MTVAQAMPTATPAAVAPAPRSPDAASAGAQDSISLPIGTSLAQAERMLILATLQHYKHQKERTAAALGISLKTLYNRLKDYTSGDDGGAGPPPSA